MSISRVSDFLVVGGGIIGINCAKHLASKYPTSKIHLIEKENTLGTHTSTRNSSVIHAGFYYSTESFKAKFCKMGNMELTKYCEDRKLPLLKTGKIVAPLNEEENGRIQDLYQQGLNNGIDIHLLNSEQARKIEPHLQVKNKNFQYLWSPTTKVGDNMEVMKSMTDDLKQLNNVQVFTNSKYQSIEQRNPDSISIKISDQIYETKKFINCAGLYADQIAKEFNLCQKYVALPFKGLYIIDKDYENYNKKLKTLIYPVPPAKGNHFLGVHVTLTCDGKLKFGPTATPTLSKENYNGFENITKMELLEILKEYIKNVFSSKFMFYLRHLQKEIPKHYMPKVFHDAGKLVDIYSDLKKNIFGYPFSKNIVFSKPGIRAQLVNVETRELVNDFIVEEDKNSLHLLNVVSPGWTCSIPLTKYIIDKYL